MSVCLVAGESQLSRPEAESNQIYLEPTSGLPPLIVVTRSRLTQQALYNFRQSYARAVGQENPLLIIEGMDCDLYQLVAGRWEPVRRPEIDPADAQILETRVIPCQNRPSTTLPSGF